MCKFCGMSDHFLLTVAFSVAVLLFSSIITPAHALRKTAGTAVPNAPVLPNEFRTTFNVSNNNNPLGHVRVWYDFDHKKQRFDIFNYDSFGWTMTFNRYDLSTPEQFNLTRSLNTWLCIPGKLTAPMQAPNFLSATSVKYQGTQQSANGVSCNTWLDSATGKTWFTAVSSPFDLVQMVMPDKATVITFGKIHAGNVDPNVFSFPSGSKCPTATRSTAGTAEYLTGIFMEKQGSGPLPPGKV